MRTSENIAALAAALSKAQAEIQDPIKDTDNDFFKSSYANLHTVLSAVRPVFGEHGLSVIQLPCGDGGNVGLVTRLLHESGEWIEGDALSINIGNAKNPAQAAGAVITYLRRYALSACAGVFQADDDGNVLANTGPVYVTTEHAANIDTLIDEVGADRKKFLAHFKVAKVTEIPETRYDEVVNALEHKRAA